MDSAKRAEDLIVFRWFGKDADVLRKFEGLWYCQRCNHLKQNETNDSAQNNYPEKRKNPSGRFEKYGAGCAVTTDIPERHDARGKRPLKKRYAARKPHGLSPR